MTKTPDGYVRADTDGELYKREDTVWLVAPPDDDPGVLAPAPEAVSKATEDSDADAAYDAWLGVWNGDWDGDGDIEDLGDDVY